MRLLVLASDRLDPFQVAVLDSLYAAAGAGVELVGAVIDRRPPAGWFARLRRHVRNGRGGYALVLAAQRLARPRGGSAEGYFSRHGSAALAATELDAPATLDFIRACQPDCIFRSGFGIIRGPVLSIAPRGVISFHHGDLRAYRGLPPAFWELYHGRRQMGVTVQQLTDQLDAGRIVCETSVPIGPGDSWSALHRRAYAASVPMVVRACQLLDDPAFQPTALPPGELGVIYTLPNLRQWLALQWRVLWRKTRGSRPA